MGKKGEKMREKFQSSPEPKPERHGGYMIDLIPFKVSILARAKARASPKETRLNNIPIKFQSSPEPKPERHTKHTSHPSFLQCFNPRPSQSPSVTGPLCSTSPETMGFNPRPSQSPSVTWHRQLWFYHGSSFNPRPSQSPSVTTLQSVVQAKLAVSILARAKARASHARDLRPDTEFDVSILARAKARASQPTHTIKSNIAQFQSSPEPKPERHICKK